MEKSMANVTTLVEKFEASAVSSIAKGTLLGDALEKLGEYALETAKGILEIPGALLELGAHGSEVADVQHGFELFAGSVEHATAILGGMRAGTVGTIADFDLMKQSLHLMAADVTMTTADYGTLTQGARVLAHEGFGTVTDMLDTLSNAMITGRMRTAQKMLGVIETKVAEADYAKQLGVTVAELSKAGKAEADRGALLDKLRSAIAEAGEQELTFAERIEQGKAAWSNFTDALGVAIAQSPVMISLFQSIKEALTQAFGGTQADNVRTLMGSVNELAIRTTDLGLATVAVAGVFHIAWSAVSSVVLGVVAGFAALAASTASVYAAVAQGMTLLPGASPQTRDLAKSAKEAADDLWLLAHGLDAEAQDAFKGVTAHSEFDKTLDKLGGTLFAMRDKMVAASQVTVTQAELVEGLRKTHEQAAQTMSGKLAPAIGLVSGNTEKETELLVTLQKTQDTWALGIGELNTRIPDLNDHLKDQAAIFQDVYDNGAPLVSFVETFTDGITIAGDELDHVTIPAFTALATGVLPQMTAAIKNATTAQADSTLATRTWQGELRNVASEFGNLGNAVGGTFGAIARDIDLAIKEVLNLSQELQKINKLSGDASGASGASGAASSLGVYAGYASIVTGIVTFVIQMGNALDAERLASIAADVQMRVRAATMRAFSADVGAAQAAITKFYESESSGTVVNAFGRLADTEAKREEVSRAMNLTAVIQALGGAGALTATQLTEAYKEMRDLVTIATSGGAEGAKAITQLDGALTSIGTAAIASTGLVSQAFLDMSAKAQAAGVTLAGVHALILTAAKGGATGLNEVTGGIGGLALTQTEAAGLAASVAADFAKMWQSGMSFKDALAAIQPSITALTKEMDAAGVQGGAAFDLLRKMSVIASDAVMGPLATAIQGTNTALQGLHNSGVLNQAMFTGLSQTAVDAFNTIVKQGGDGTAALAMMQPTLQTIWELQQKFHYQVDDTTQALLNQAEAAGTVGEKYKSPADQMLDATNKMADALLKVVNILSNAFPAAATIAAAAINGIPTTLPIHFNDPTPSGGSPSIPLGDGSNSNILPFAPRGASGSATLTVPIQIDGREIARATVPLIPGELRRLGLA
jgi:hypothetical protein